MSTPPPPPPPGYGEQPPSPPGYGGPPPPPAFPAYIADVRRPRTNGMSIASLVLGILSIPLFCTYGVLAVLAIVFGHVALSQIKKSMGAQSGRGMAIAGLVCGYIGLALVIVLIAALIAGDGTWEWNVD